MRKTSGLSHYQDWNHCNSKMRQGSNTFAQSGKSLDACDLQKLTAIRIVTDQGFWQEKAMAPHSSTLAWKIPWTEEPRGLQSLGSQRVGHDWATSLSLFTFHALEKEMATHSSVLAWRIPGMVESGGLPSMGSHRVGHDWSDLAVAVVSCLYF